MGASPTRGQHTLKKVSSRRWESGAESCLRLTVKFPGIRSGNETVVRRGALGHKGTAAGATGRRNPSWRLAPRTEPEKRHWPCPRGARLSHLTCTCCSASACHLRWRPREGTESASGPDLPALGGSWGDTNVCGLRPWREGPWLWGVGRPSSSCCPRRKENRKRWGQGRMGTGGTRTSDTPRKGPGQAPGGRRGGRSVSYKPTPGPGLLSLLWAQGSAEAAWLFRRSACQT